MENNEAEYSFERIEGGNFGKKMYFPREIGLIRTTSVNNIAILGNRTQ